MKGEEGAGARVLEAGTRVLGAGKRVLGAGTRVLGAGFGKGRNMHYAAGEKVQRKA